MEKKICLSIEQMQKLKELDVETQSASLVRIPYDEDGIEIDPSLFNKEETAWWDDENKCWVKSFYMECQDAETGDYDHSHRDEYATFTLQDMLELMPNTIDEDSNLNIYFHEDGVSIFYETSYECQPSFFSNSNILDSAFEMLVWLAKNGYLKTIN